MHTVTTTNVTTIRIKTMVTPIDTPTTIPIDPGVVGELAVGLSVNGIESVIWGTR